MQLSVDFLVAWEVLQALGFRVWREKRHKGHLWPWNPSMGFCTHWDLGQNHDEFEPGKISGDRACQANSNAPKITGIRALETKL